jgi:hypothetical protein
MVKRERMRVISSNVTTWVFIAANDSFRRAFWADTWAPTNAPRPAESHIVNAKDIGVRNLAGEKQLLLETVQGLHIGHHSLPYNL